MHQETVADSFGEYGTSRQFAEIAQASLWKKRGASP